MKENQLEEEKLAFKTEKETEEFVLIKSISSSNKIYNPSINA